MRHFYVESSLQPGQTLTLPAPLQHRLAKVLRLAEGAEIGLFNNQGSGLMAATLADAKCRTAHIGACLQAAPKLPPFKLALALPKRDAWESALRQATELGVTDIFPLETDHTVASRLNDERVHGMVVEAAEQCERLSLPHVHPLQSLETFLKSHPQPIAWAFERQTPGPASPRPAPTTVLVGPEGGFSPAEIQLLQSLPHVQAFSLGPTILRVDTAVVAALTLVRP